MNLITLQGLSEHFDTKKWNIPVSLTLADYNFNIPAGTDILLGSKIFRDISKK